MQDQNTAAAEAYLREKYGAYRGHPEWRALEQAFIAGVASKQCLMQISEPAGLLPQWLTNKIGVYGDASRNSRNQVEITHRWAELIAAIKRYAALVQAAPAAVALPANLPTGDEIRAIARSVSTSSSDSPSSSEYVMAGYRAALAATQAADGYTEMLEESFGITDPAAAVPAVDTSDAVAEMLLLEEVCARYADDEDRYLAGNGEAYGSIPTEAGMRARAARKRFNARQDAASTEGGREK